MAGNARHQQYAAQQVHHQVAPRRVIGAGPGRPDDQGRADRHDLPKDEHGDEVAGAGHADRAACIDKRGRRFERVGLAHGEQAAGKRHDREDGRKKPPDRCALQHDQVIIQHMDGECRAVGCGPDHGQRKQRCTQDQHGA